ncbi:Guanine deaminase [Microbulbifer aggregans]|uniref:Guanine deaminase n=1 Tax=Microbulbifer aggregans TaxID=1769779 RepID=A0A1C9W9U2_9GAMM|nr:nucleoside deaminase [Microbulbifer aggregans]AOS97920.1 Guanine deaminase [Microbulbifer aggregans]
MGNRSEDNQRDTEHQKFLARAVKLAQDNVTREGGRPFGAVLVRGGRIVAEAVNTIHRSADVTAHAEIEALRAATTAAGNHRLDGAVMYASGHPCPMCLAAMYLSGVSAIYYALSLKDAEPYGISTDDIYQELAKPPASRQIPMEHIHVMAAEKLYPSWSQTKANDGPA